MKLKSVSAAVVGGTIVIYLVKPSLDWFAKFLTNTSNSIFSGWQNRVYKKIPLFDTADLSIQLLFFMTMAFILVLLIYTITEWKTLKIKSNKLAKQEPKQEAKQEAKQSTEKDITSLKKKINLSIILLTLYSVFVVGYFLLFFAERLIMVNETKKYNCKISLIEATSQDEIINLIKLKWLKTKTKKENTQFHEYVDSILISNQINYTEYCNLD